MNKETINSIIFSAKENTDFDFIEKYDEEAKKSEIARNFTSAVISYEHEICYLYKVYRFAISAHNENSQYQTYNGKHFLETAQKWKNEIIKIHKHILEIAREHKDLFEGYEIINLDELFQD